MITRPYLLSTTSSRSSIGGLMMPSTAEVPATLCLSGLSARSVGRLGRHQGYQLAAYILDGRVDKRGVNLPLRLQLWAPRLQPPGKRPGGVGLRAFKPRD